MSEDKEYVKGIARQSTENAPSLYSWSKFPVFYHMETVFFGMGSSRNRSVQFVVKQEDENYVYYCSIQNLYSVSTYFQNTKLTSEANQKEILLTIQVDDLSPFAVLCVIGFANGCPVRLGDTSSTVDVLKAAKRFEMGKLVEICECRLVDVITLRNVCHILRVAIQYNLTSLKDKCLRTCADGAFVVFGTRGFLSLNAEDVVEILCTPDVNVDNVVDLAYFLWAWSIADCCRKSLKLTNAYVLSRFVMFHNFVDPVEFMKEFGKVFCAPDVRDTKLVGACLYRAVRDPSKIPCDYFAGNDYLNRSHRVLLPLPLPDSFCRKVVAEPSCDEPFMTGCHAGAFVVTRPCYLLSFSVVCVSAPGDNSHLEKIVIGSTYMPSFLWDGEEESFFQVVSTQRHSASLHDRREVVETKFEATRLLHLHQGVNYRLTMVTSGSRARWPAMRLVKQKAPGLNIHVISPKMHALSQIILLEK